jgi:hypothetical protein
MIVPENTLPEAVRVKKRQFVVKYFFVVKCLFCPRFSERNLSADLGGTLVPIGIILYTKGNQRQRNAIILSKKIFSYTNCRNNITSHYVN